MSRARQAKHLAVRGGLGQAVGDQGGGHPLGPCGVVGPAHHGRQIADRHGAPGTIGGEPPASVVTRGVAPKTPREEEVHSGTTGELKEQAAGARAAGTPGAAAWHQRDEPLKAKADGQDGQNVVRASLANGQKAVENMQNP